MITAKQAKDGTRIESYIEEKCKEIEGAIRLCMEIGLGYCRYRGPIPSAIVKMLEELGYKVYVEDDIIHGEGYCITWGQAPDKDEYKCN